MNELIDTSEVATKEEIMRAAAILFQERGYAKTKVVDIARAVGITAPTLYWHYASKEDILFEYLSSNLELFNTGIFNAIEGIENPVDQLRALAVAHTTAQLRFRQQAQAVLAITHSAAQLSANLSPERLNQVRLGIRAHIIRTREIVEAGIACGRFAVPSVSALVFAILNVCEYTVLWFKPDGLETAEAVAAANGELVVRMAIGKPIA